MSQIFVGKKNSTSKKFQFNFSEASFFQDGDQDFFFLILKKLKVAFLSIVGDADDGRRDVQEIRGKKKKLVLNHQHKFF